METIQVRNRGTLTLPANLRQKYSIEPGDTFQVLDLDGIIVLSPLATMVPELAKEIEKLREAAGYTTEELLVSLREEREKYYKEIYGDK